MQVTIEIIGLSEMACGPFPCDDERSCGLVQCHPTERLVPAFHALREALQERYGDEVTLTLTLVDDGLPERIARIVEEYQPPLPIVLVNGRVTPIGRISLPLIEKEIAKVRA
jgi:hypothetical protein